MNDLPSLAEHGRRLALTLCGSAAAARDAAIGVVTSFPDATLIATARFESRIVEEARLSRADASPSTWPRDAQQLWNAARRLPETDFELWALAALHGKSAEELTLIFDLPSDLISRSLANSQSALRTQVGSAYDGALGALRQSVETSTDPAFSPALADAVARASRRRRGWAIVKIAAFLVITVIVSYTLIDLMRWKGDSKGRPIPPESPLSVPKPAASPAP